MIPSTGYKSGILGPNSFEDLFDGGTIRVYNGTPPTSADAPAVGTMLGQVAQTPTGPGLTFLREGPYVSKFLDAVWTLLVQNAGTPTYARLTGPGDDGTAPSTTLPRLQLVVGIEANPATELAVPTLTMLVGHLVDIGYFFHTIPPIPAE